MIRFVVIFALGALLFTLSAGAQTKKRLTFKKNYAEVSGTIRQAETLEYVFRVRKNADIEIWVDREKTPGAKFPNFVLLRPNGKLFYDRGSVNYGVGTDLMDILPQAGDYTIRLQLPEDMRGAGEGVKFTLRLRLQ